MAEINFLNNQNSMQSLFQLLCVFISAGKHDDIYALFQHHWSWDIVYSKYK